MTELAIIAFPDKIVYNRGAAADSFDRTLTFYGRYDGSTNVQFRILNAVDDTEVDTWANVTASDNVENSFYFTYDFPVGGMYYFQVKYSTGSPMTQTSNDFGIGLQIWLLGEDNASILATETGAGQEPTNDNHFVFFSSTFKAPHKYRFYPLKEQFLTPSSIGLKNILNPLNTFDATMPVAIIVCGVNKSSSRKWADDRCNNPYGNFLALFHRLGGHAEFFAFINGETDAIDKMPADIYVEKGLALLDKLKNDCKHFQTLFMLLPKLGMDGANSDIIRAAQVTLQGDAYIVPAGDLRTANRIEETKYLEVSSLGTGALGTAISTAIVNLID
jgi:hypothetical protein